jgi:MFS family permease
MLQAPTMGAYMSRLAPPAARGRYLGIYGSTFSAAWVLAPILGARIRACHADALWYCSAAFALLAALGLRAMARTTPATHPEPSPETSGSGLA